MGHAQSSRIEITAPSTRTPASVLRLADYGEISAEDLADAYGLGLRDNAMLTCEVEQMNHGLTPGLRLGNYVALDCEMVGVGRGGVESTLARVSIVDFHGRQVYDSFVRPREEVTNWRTDITGIGPQQMSHARAFDIVQPLVANILKGRVLVGHDVYHDLGVLQLKHPKRDIRDTVMLRDFRRYANGGKPSLRVLAYEILGLEVHQGVHSSIEDARVTMALFRSFKPRFDSDHIARFPDSSSARYRGSSDAKSEKGEKKKKKKRSNKTNNKKKSKGHGKKS